MLGHFRIPFPPLEEQQAIIFEVEAAHVKTQEIVENLLRSIALAKERRAALITAAVTGQIPIEAMCP